MSSNAAPTGRPRSSGGCSIFSSRLAGAARAESGGLGTDREKDRDVRGKNTKPEQKFIGVFGANGHIGGPVARYVAANSPQTKLRLIIRVNTHRAALAAEFPDADIVVANYYDPASLEPALSTSTGLFVVTPDFLDEERAMTNLVHAAGQSSLCHIVRLIADPPGMTMDRIPPALKRFGGGTAVQRLQGAAGEKRPAADLHQHRRLLHAEFPDPVFQRADPRRAHSLGTAQPPHGLHRHP